MPESLNHCQNGTHTPMSTYFKLILVLMCFASTHLVQCQEQQQQQQQQQPGNISRKAPIRKRIAGGYYCPIEDYPFAVSLRSVHSFHPVCSGTLIQPYWVMTAAHCLENITTQDIFVLAGTPLLQGPGARISHPQEFFMHRNYNLSRKIHDIGLILLKKPFAKSRTVSFATLPHQSDMSLENCTKAHALGWGRLSPTDEGTYPSVWLKCVELPIIQNNLCAFLYNDRKILEMTMNFVCTLPSYGDHGDPCRGDSGGPLVCHGTVIGIVSYGYLCAVPMAPTVFTRVRGYLDYMEEVLQAHGSTLRNYKFEDEVKSKSARSLEVVNLAVIFLVFVLIYLLSS